MRMERYDTVEWFFTLSMAAKEFLHICLLHRLGRRSPRRQQPNGTHTLIGLSVPFFSLPPPFKTIRTRDKFLLPRTRAPASRAYEASYA